MLVGGKKSNGVGCPLYLSAIFARGSNEIQWQDCHFDLYRGDAAGGGREGIRVSSFTSALLETSVNVQPGRSTLVFAQHCWQSDPTVAEIQLLVTTRVGLWNQWI